MHQMAFQHPNLMHLNITPLALRMGYLQSEFSPFSTLVLELDDLLDLGDCGAVIG